MENPLEPPDDEASNPAADTATPGSRPSTGTPPIQIVELRAGGLRAALRPDLGGALAGLWRHGRPVLEGREARSLRRVEEAACFPCAPYAQHLGQGVLRWMGKTYRLQPYARGDGVDGHALHGPAWLRRWDVLAVSADAAVIRYVHSPDDSWPFAFHVDQTVEITRSTLSIQLELTNRHTAPQPAGLGWQVAFARGPQVRIDFRCTERWDLDPATRLPARKVPVAGVEGLVDGLHLDHTYEDWARSMRVRGPTGSVRLRASLDRLAATMLDARGRKLEGCWRVGPVSHAPDAFHMSSPTANGLEVLPPGASIQGWMKLVVSG